MSATAARLFVAPDLGAGGAIEVTPEQAHYLRNVLRSTQLQQLQAFAVFLPCRNILNKRDFE